MTRYPGEHLDAIFDCGNKMLDEAVATAKHIRSQHKRQARNALENLAAEARDLQEIRPIDTIQLRVLMGRMPLVEQKIQKFSDAVIKCQVLEATPVEDDDDQRRMDTYEQQSDELETLFLDTCSVINALKLELDETRSTGLRAPCQEINGARGSSKRMDIPKLKSPEDMKLIDFRDWKVRFEDFAAITRLAHDCNLEARRGIIRSAIHEDWTKLWSEGLIPITEEADVDEIVSALEGYLRDKRHPLVDRRAFIQRDQGQGKSMESYYAALRALDRDCGYNHKCPEAAVHQEERLCGRRAAFKKLLLTK